MSSVSSRRVARLAAGLSVAAAATLLGTAPAYAATPVTTTLSGQTLIVIGTSFADAVTVTGDGVVSLSNTLGSISAGTGCTQFGTDVRCSGVRSIVFNGLGGDDSFRNKTPMSSDLRGGSGDDRITGGPGNDRISGGSGNDFAFGLEGFDTCFAENESGCEV